MTLPSHKNRRTTRRNIPRPTRCDIAAVLVVVAAFAIPATDSRADEPAKLVPESSSPRDPGQALIESLQNRSAIDRWILLRREQRGERQIAEEHFGKLDAPVASAELTEDKPASAVDTSPSLKPFPSTQAPVPAPELSSDGVPAFVEPRVDPPVAGVAPPELSPQAEPLRIAQAPAKKKARGDDRLRKITDILPYHDYSPDTDRKKDGKLPAETWESKPYEPRNFDDVLFTWEASDLYHNPLYFEDPALERYGHTYPEIVQPFASVGRFSLQLFGLPYQMTIDPICSKHYTLGWYRPGECAPKLLYQIPWNTRAAKVQAGVMTGLFYLIP